MSVRSGGGGGARGGGGRSRGGGGEGRVRGTSWKDAHADVSSATNIADLKALLDVPPIAGEKDETYLVWRALLACQRLGALEKESKGGGKHAQLWGMLVDIVKPHMSEFANDHIFIFLQGISSHFAASGVNLLDDDMDLRAAFEERVIQIHMYLTFATLAVMTEMYKCSAKPPHHCELYPCLEARLCDFHSSVTPLNKLKVQGHFDRAIANFKACSERHGYIIPEVTKAKLVVPALSTDFQAQLQQQERQTQQLRSGGAIKHALGYQQQQQQHQQQAVHTPPQPLKQVADEDVIFNCSNPNALADVYYNYAQTLTLKRLILFYKKIKKEASKNASILQGLGPLWEAIAHEVMRFMCEAQGADLAIILESHVECKTDPTVELQQVIDQRAVQLLESGAVQQMEVTRIVFGYARLASATPSSRLMAVLLGETGNLSTRMGAAEVGMSIYGWGMLSHSSALDLSQPHLAIMTRGLMDRVRIILSNEVDPEHAKMSAFDLSWVMWGFFNFNGLNPKAIIPYDLLELVQARAIQTLGPDHPEELARFVRAWAWTGKPPSEEAVEAWQTCIVGLTMDDQNETGGGLGPASMSMLMYSFSIMNVMKDFSTLAIKSMEDHSINIINGYDFTNVALTLWSYAWSGMLPCAELLQKLIQQGIACCDDDANSGSPHQAKGNEIANTLWSLAAFKDMSPMHCDGELFREFIRCLSKKAVDMYFTFTLQNIVDSLNAFVSMRFQSSSLQNHALVQKLVEKIHTEIHQLRLDQLADILLALNELLPATAVDEHFLHCMDERACVLLEQNSYVQYPEVLARLVISYTGHEEERMKRMPPPRLIELLFEEFYTSSCNDPLLLQQWWIFAMHLVLICGVRTKTVTSGIHVGLMVKKLLVMLKEDPRSAPPANVSQHAEEMAKVLIEMGYAARIGERDEDGGTKYALDIMFLYQHKKHVLLVQSDDDVVSSGDSTSMRRAARAKCSLLKARHFKVVPVAIHQWMNLPDRLTPQGLLQQVVQAVVAQPDNS